MLYFSRENLAAQLAKDLRGENVFSDAPNGLFLSAPRRTGKSMFLQMDLKPTLEHLHTIVIYVDLWADVSRDPGVLIVEAIGKEAQKHLGVVAKTAKSAGLKKNSFAGAFEIDTSKIGSSDGTTLYDALYSLHKITETPIALIIDEAQHALTSEAGESAMAALKSARDQMNKPGNINLMLIMSGSDRDKLMRLVNTNASPFFGSQIHSMPLLDKDFVLHIADLIEAKNPDLRPVNIDVLFDTFKKYGCRPQFFMESINTVLSPLFEGSGRFENLLYIESVKQQEEDKAQMESDFLSLKPLEQAVLWRLLEIKTRFRPYDSQALKFYREQTGQAVTATKVQNALDSLRIHHPPLVWKSARGEYAVDDSNMYVWYAEKVSSDSWPPNM
jgi:hypothetical protein